MRQLTRTLLLTTALGLAVPGLALAQDDTVPAGVEPAEEIEAAEPALDEPMPTEPAGPPIAVELDAPSYVTWIDGAVRDQPAGISERIATLPFGTRVTVTGEVAGSNWVRVELEDGTIGYMWAELLAPLQIGGPAGGDGGADGVTGDDVPDTAQAIGPLGPEGFTTNGTLSSTDINDYFSFSVDDWTEVTVALSGLSADVDVFLTDTSGYQYGAGMNAGTTPEELTVTIGPGSYFVYVSNYDATDTGYQLTLSATPGEEPPPDGGSNFYDRPTPLGVLETGAPLTVTEWVGPVDYEDYFGFEITDTKRVTVLLDGMTADADITLYGGRDWLYLASSTNYLAEPDQIIATLEPGYYVVGVNNAGNQTSYTLTLSAEDAEPLPPDSAGNYNEEALSIGDPTAGAISVTEWVGPLDSDDFFHISLSRTAEVAIVLRPASADADLDLLSANGMNYLASSASGGTNVDRIIQTLEPGDYNIRVYTYGGETSYTLDISAK